MRRGLVALLLFVLAGPLARGQSAVQSDVARQQLVPSGHLRVGLNYGNVVLARREKPGDAPSGVAVDVARELAKRLGTTAEFVGYDDAGSVVDAAGKAWDVAFVGIDPARASVVAFTSPYVIVEAAYLVRADSSLRSLADVDRPGVKIAAGPRSAYGLFLSRTLKQAEMVPVTGDAALAALQAGSITVVAGLRSSLTVTASPASGFRVLPGNFTGIEQGMAVPVANTAARDYLESFVAELKKSGFVAAAIQRTGYTGASVPR